jgi:hypothetical protein
VFYCTIENDLYLQFRVMSLLKEINIMPRNPNFLFTTATITTWRTSEFVNVIEASVNCFKGLDLCAVINFGKLSKFC